MLYLFKKNEHGFTIVELAISLAITLILLGVTIRVFTIQRNAYTLQEHTTDLHQNIRIGMDVLSREIRMAGYMVSGTSTIQVSGTSTITFLGDIDSDIATVLALDAGAGTTTVFVELTPDSNYNIGNTDYIYISDGLHTDLIPVNSSAPHLVGEPDPIYLKTGLLYSYTAGNAIVRTVERVTFSHDTTNLRINRNNQPLAENIEILRFTYGTNTQTGATNTVTISITGRTAQKYSNYPGDGYCRGTLTSTIKLRNQ
ncbi:MAG: prepilin-type N-terminal cleavage/methylation domain-containing protein [Candidatus Brocadia sp.]|jgi:Tfp pilus assembly protein PilE